MLYLLLMIIPLLLGIWAQARISSSYAKWSKVRSHSNITGADTALAVMQQSGIYDVEIVEIPGHLTDHYSPLEKRLALSRENFRGTSLAALGVAAHEAGHAIQHKANYTPLKFRAALIPITNIASRFLPFIIFGGLVMGLFGLIKLGVAVYAILTTFQLITLPIEFDASFRARKALITTGILDRNEIPGVIDILNAAGFTYAAAFISSLANLIFFALMSRRE